MQFYNIAIELVIGYIALFTATKILGKSTITQLTPFDFISSIVLGELVGNALYDKEIGVSNIVFAILVWGSLIYITEWITQKFRRTRSFLEGSPSILINKGRLSFQELKTNHLDINQLQHLLRTKDVFNMREVEYAILETDGTLSVAKKYVYDVPIRQDHNYPEKPVYISTTLIADGEVLRENLSELGFSETWLTKELDKHNTTINKVLYADWLEGEGLFLQKY